MRKIVVSMSVSVDGYFEGPDHDLGWHLVDEELHQHFNDELRTSSAFLDGRVTWELMADFWPTADADPSNPEVMREFARIWRDMPKIVYSTTLESAGWKTTVVHQVDADEVRALKAQPGGDLVLGGGVLIEEFRRLDLIDEYRLYVHPVLLGRGTLLFRPSDAPAGLRLVETRTFGNGVVLLRYERSPDGH